MARVLDVYKTPKEWTDQNPTLDAGQIGVEKFTKKFKVGTGAHPWNALDYAIQETTGLAVIDGGKA